MTMVWSYTISIIIIIITAITENENMFVYYSEEMGELSSSFAVIETLERWALVSFFLLHSRIHIVRKVVNSMRPIRQAKETMGCFQVWVEQLVLSVIITFDDQSIVVSGAGITVSKAVFLVDEGTTTEQESAELLGDGSKEQDSTTESLANS